MATGLKFNLNPTLKMLKKSLSNISSLKLNLKEKKRENIKNGKKHFALVFKLFCLKLIFKQKK